MSNVERAKLIQAFSNDTRIHSLIFIFKVHSKTIETIVNKIEEEEIGESKIGSRGHNHKRDHRFNLGLKRTIRREIQLGL